MPAHSYFYLIKSPNYGIRFQIVFTFFENTIALWIFLRFDFAVNSSIKSNQTKANDTFDCKAKKKKTKNSRTHFNIYEITQGYKLNNHQFMWHNVARLYIISASPFSSADTSLFYDLTFDDGKIPSICSSWIVIKMAFVNDNCSLF